MFRNSYFWEYSFIQYPQPIQSEHDIAQIDCQHDGCYYLHSAPIIRPIRQQAKQITTSAAIGSSIMEIVKPWGCQTHCYPWPQLRAGLSDPGLLDNFLLLAYAAIRIDFKQVRMGRIMAIGYTAKAKTYPDTSALANVSVVSGFHFSSPYSPLTGGLDNSFD